jgi:MFS family permease
LSLVASLVAVRLFDEWFSFLPTGSIEPVRSELDLTYRQVAVLLTLMWVGGLVGGLAGIAADRMSRRALASLGAFGYGLSLACWGLGQEWWVLAVGSLLLGVSADAMLAACEVALVDLAGDDLVRVLAPGNLGAEVGDLIGPLLLAG